jgi:hypothetical protein
MIWSMNMIYENNWRQDNAHIHVSIFVWYDQYFIHLKKNL